MLRLTNTTTDLLKITTTANGARVMVDFSDKTSAAYTGGNQPTSITSATTTTICSTPAASTVRDIDHVAIRATAANTITVIRTVSATDYEETQAVLATGETLEYTHADGWRTKDANGVFKYTQSGVAVASGKTLTISNTLTLTATDGSTLAIGTGGTLAGMAYQSGSWASPGAAIGTGTPVAGTFTTGLFTGAITVASIAQTIKAVGGTNSALTLTAGGTTNLDADTTMNLRVGGSTSFVTALNFSALGAATFYGTVNTDNKALSTGSGAISGGAISGTYVNITTEGTGYQIDGTSAMYINAGGRLALDNHYVKLINQNTADFAGAAAGFDGVIAVDKQTSRLVMYTAGARYYINTDGTF